MHQRLVSGQSLRVLSHRQSDIYIAHNVYYDKYDLSNPELPRITLRLSYLLYAHDLMLLSYPMTEHRTDKQSPNDGLSFDSQDS
jgi:hypothetical protein